MPTPRIPLSYNSELYFLTCTITDWHQILNNHGRFDILLHSLLYCQSHKDLKIFAWVFMNNHIHLIVKSPDVSGFVRDFKKYTAFELMKNLQKTEPEMAMFFALSNGKYCIWEKTNMPKMIETEEFYFQKKEYIEQNPVRKNYVAAPEDWPYSSAAKTPLIRLDVLEEL